MIKPQCKKFFAVLSAILFAGLVGIQFVPSSFSRSNPPVTGEPMWDSPETRKIFFATCSDCHSNESKFPWYSSIAPVSWLIESDVRNGRKHFNISEWDRSHRGGDNAADEVQKGGMPIGPYLLMHPEANLNTVQKKKFVEGLKRTFGENEKTNSDRKE